MKVFITKIWKQFLSYFGQGLIFILPIGLTIMLLVTIFQKLDAVLELETPGLGLLIILVLITVVGLLGSLLISSPVFKYFNRLIDKAPIIKMIYNSIKDLLSVFVGNKKKFTEPVLVKMSENFDMEQMGFVTQTDLKDMGISGDKVSVYIPYSFSFMGTVYIVPAKNVQPLHVKPQDALKFVVSGGISKTEEDVKK